jgi:hypothetical protein
MNSPAHSTNLQSGNAQQTPQRPSIRGQIVIALYSYQGSEFGDMSFQKGDQMEIVDDS